jgi:Terminase large subunit, T4likevirus-type, N-terminal
MIEWRPNPGKQEEFLSLPDSIFEALYGGALGGGKTEALVMLPIVRQFYKEPQFNGIIFRRTFPQLEKDVIPLAKRFYIPTGAKYNDTKHSFIWANGATMHMGHLENIDDREKHDGIEYNYIGWDELAHFLQPMYDYLIMRCRTASNLPAIMRSSAMPGGVGHSWVRERFIDPAPEGGKILSRKIDGHEVFKGIFIPARMSDNPVLMEKDPNYINRLRVLSDTEFKAKAEGDWYAFLGMVFPEFRPDRRVNEPENALHVIKPFPIPYWWPRVAAGDWGFKHSTWLGKAAISPDMRIFVYYEYCQKEKYIAEWAAEFKQSCQGENIESFELDPSAWQRRGDEKTIAQQFMDISGLRANPADNDRIGGKMLIHEMLRWRARPPRYIPAEGFNIDTRNYVLRNYGTEKAKEYERTFEPEELEKNLPRLQIFNTCKELIKTLQSLAYDEKDIEDVQKYDGDDPYDGLRYLLKAVDRYTNGLTAKEKEFVLRGNALRALEENGNQTAFYRRMEQIESRKNKNLGVRLFH